MVVSGSGRVGIGTESPSASLAVEGDAELIAQFSRGSGDGNAGIQIRSGGSSDTSYVYFDDMSEYAYRSTGRGQILYHHGTDSMRFVTSGDEKFRINNAGVVRISSSLGRLEVTGSDAHGPKTTRNQTAHQTHSRVRHCFSILPVTGILSGNQRRAGWLNTSRTYRLRVIFAPAPLWLTNRALWALARCPNVQRGGGGARNSGGLN